MHVDHTPVAAIEMPGLRRRLVAACDDIGGKVAREAFLLEFAEKPEDDPFVAMDKLTLQQGELLHIAPSLVEIADHAGRSLDDFGFMPYDLPCDAGIAYLDADLPREHDGEHWTERLLVTWRIVPFEADEFPYGALRLAFYVERATWMASARHMGMDANAEMTLRIIPEFLFDGYATLAFNPEAAKVEDKFWASGLGLAAAARGDLFRALCYLLGQQVTTETIAEMPRAERRRAKREGVDPPAVRVLSLRSSHGGGASQSSREYVHRWMVRGHWRKQWYPSIQQNRPKFIAPYVKGPDDAPLIGGERVYRATG